MGCLWLLSCFFEDYNFTTFSPLSSHPFLAKVLVCLNCFIKDHAIAVVGECDELGSKKRRRTKIINEIFYPPPKLF
jgi:hypothetical protein